MIKPTKEYLIKRMKENKVISNLSRKSKENHTRCLRIDIGEYFWDKVESWLK